MPLRQLSLLGRFPRQPPPPREAKEKEKENEDEDEPIERGERERTLHRLRSWLRAPTRGTLLLLSGPTGAGKTHMLTRTIDKINKDNKKAGLTWRLRPVCVTSTVEGRLTSRQQIYGAKKGGAAPPLLQVTGDSGGPEGEVKEVVVWVVDPADTERDDEGVKATLHELLLSVNRAGPEQAHPMILLVSAAHGGLLRGRPRLAALMRRYEGRLHRLSLPMLATPDDLRSVILPSRLRGLPLPWERLLQRSGGNVLQAVNLIHFNLAHNLALPRLADRAPRIIATALYGRKPAAAATATARAKVQARARARAEAVAVAGEEAELVEDEECAREILSTCQAMAPGQVSLEGALDLAEVCSLADVWLRSGGVPEEVVGTWVLPSWALRSPLREQTWPAAAGNGGSPAFRPALPAPAPPNCFLPPYRRALPPASSAWRRRLDYSLLAQKVELLGKRERGEEDDVIRGARAAALFGRTASAVTSGSGRESVEEAASASEGEEETEGSRRTKRRRTA